LAGGEDFLERDRGDLIGQEFFITTEDGWQLALEEFEPWGNIPKATLLLGPAMMVNRRSLDRPAGKGLASYLSHQGFRVYTLDPRGHGASRPKASRSEDWSYDQIIDYDLPGVLRELRRRHPNAPLVLMGHSLCGHAGAAALARHPDLQVDALVLIAANAWVRAAEPRSWRWMCKRLVTAAWKITTNRYGYFPAKRLGVGSDDEARSYVKQLARFVEKGTWCNQDGSVDYYPQLANVRIPVLSVNGKGDWLLSNRDSAGWFNDGLCNAPVVSWEIAASDYHAQEEPGHMTLVVDNRCHPVWQRLAKWIEEATTP
jgi:predicted alpha/beta hydrolase